MTLKRQENLGGKVTITRNSNDKITITFHENHSRADFATMTMEMADFALAVTGVYRCPATLDTFRINEIGKKKITEERNRSIPGELKYQDLHPVRSWLMDNFQEEGWELDVHLGAQNSFYRDDNTATEYVRYYVSKYVDLSE